MTGSHHQEGATAGGPAQLPPIQPKSGVFPGEVASVPTGISSGSSKFLLFSRLWPEVPSQRDTNQGIEKNLLSVPKHLKELRHSLPFEKPARRGGLQRQEGVHQVRTSAY